MSMRRIVAAGFALALAACGGGGGGGGAAGGSASFAFTSAAGVSVAENSAGAFYTATVSGAAAPAFTIAGGADAARFAISGAGALSFAAPPDFESPADADRNNVYLVTLQAASGAATATLALAVTVTDRAGALASRRVGQGFVQPLFLAGTGDGTGRVFVVQKGGLIRILTPATGAIAATPFLDVSTEISTGGERGLLGLVLAPDYAASRTLYVYLTNPSGTIEVRRYRTLAADRDRVDAATADVILTIPHPTFDNHNGGWMGFGPDGFLYIATGDGGGSGDPGGNAQNRNTLLGKLLRIDPRSDGFPTDANRDYAIPTGNPFAPPAGAPEVFAFGLRNPFRAGFDRTTGNLYIGDVGQGAREEIDLIRANTSADVGLNFGWNILEGTATFAGGSTAGLALPVAEYPHPPSGSPIGPFEGRSVTGGYVYRGPIAQLAGQYVFGDFIAGRIWSIPAANLVQGQTVPNTGFTARTFTPDAGAINNIASFGEDDVANLYIVDFDGEIFLVREND